MEQAFVAVAFSMVGMIAAAFATSLTLRLHQEESTQHAETLLAGAVSRTRWLAGHLLMALVGSAAAILVSGLAAGLTYGAAAGDVADNLPTVLGTAAVQLPAVWLMAAVTVALFGLVPRFTPVAWGVLVAFIAVYLLGSLANSPQWLVDLEPFAHTPRRGFRRLHCDAAGVAVGHRRRIDHIGRHRLSPPRPSLRRAHEDRVQFVASIALRTALLRHRALRARRDLPLLAGVGLHRGVHRVRNDSEPLSGSEVSRGAPTTNERGSHGGNPSPATDHHHRDGAARPGGHGRERARPPVRLVDGAAVLVWVGNVLVAVGLLATQVVDRAEQLRRPTSPSKPARSWPPPACTASCAIRCTAAS